MEMRPHRGAWRRDPRQPGNLPRQRATVTAEPAWTADRPEARRAPASGAPAQGFADEALRVRLGGCLCGAVRIEARGEPELVGLCHCEDCRKATGGLALHFGRWPREAVRVAGALKTFRGRCFCGECGGRVLHEAGASLEVLLGCLDDPPNDLRPSREIWTVRREPWLPPVAGAEQWERDPA